MKLKTGLRALWRNPNQAQIGTDPSLATTLQIQHRAEFDILHLLEADHTPAQLRRELAARGGKRERVDQLLTELRAARLVTTHNSAHSAETRVPVDNRQLLASEAETRALIEADGWRTPAKRATQKVSVYGLSRTGAHIALALASNGIGTLQLTDPRPISARDCGQIYTPKQIGEPRDQALAEIIESHGVHCQVRVRQRHHRPDAAVLVDYAVPNPTRASYLAGHHIPHLPITICELSTITGPWVTSAGPCLRCQQLWSTQQDPCWPAIATQQHARSNLTHRGEDQALADATAAFAITQILQALAGLKPQTTAHTATIALPRYQTEWATVLTHPKCQSHNRRPNPHNPPKPPPRPPLPLN
ncbi:MAG: hypothetical protein LBG11_12325 [Bifidobacteriaceae bacterium]|jgi:hypothetical protein|nr:hypothetical protein [Bifidobacteriaceae bacterium]